MADQTVHIEGHLLEHGLWCDRCLLPSAYKVAIVRRETLRRLSAFQSTEPHARAIAGTTRIGHESRHTGSDSA